MPYRVKLVKKEEVVEGIMSFHFEKPEGFIFKAGQNIDMTLVNPPETDKEGNKRTFSIVTSPSYPVLGIATRIRDTAFKRALRNATENSFEVDIEGPYGNMFLHSDAGKPAVFLAGGIGVTPFISMLWDATEKKLPHKIFLFYSNPRPESAAFLKEIQDIERENANFKLVATMTGAQLEYLPGGKRPELWQGETGRITIDLIKKYLPELGGTKFYIAGEPQMVLEMWKMLESAGVSPDEIKTEEFAGY